MENRRPLVAFGVQMNVGGQSGSGCLSNFPDLATALPGSVGILALAATSSPSRSIDRYLSRDGTSQLNLGRCLLWVAHSLRVQVNATLTVKLLRRSVSVDLVETLVLSYRLRGALIGLS
jgi:hypothetical protein